MQVQYKGLNTNRGLSPNIWANFPLEDAIRQRNHLWMYDDFNSGGLITSPTTEAALVGIPYIGFGSAGSTITHSNELGGAVVLTEATDNEAVGIKSKVGAFQISANRGDLCFEARVKLSAITDNQIGFMLGLMDDVAMTVTVPLSTANPPILATTINFVGFQGPEEDAGGVNSIYQANAVTTVEVQELVHQLVADTYVKLGMRYSRSEARLYYYVNGVQQSSYKSSIPDSTGTDFPADVLLAPIFFQRLGASTSSLSTMDWWACGQVIL
jgi:hypothetical protein